MYCSSYGSRVSCGDSDYNSAVYGVVDRVNEWVVGCGCSSEAEVEYVHAVPYSRFNGHGDVLRACVCDVSWEYVVAAEKRFRRYSAESAPHEGRAGVGDACCDAGDVASMVLGRVRVKDGADRLGAEHLCDQDLVAGVEARRVNFVDG